MMKLPVTIVIPVKNEAVNLPRCLQAIGDAFHQVVVVDSHSTDSTREIATSAGAAVLDFKWNGQFPKKRNWTLRNCQFETPWVLFLDADELITPAFIRELAEVLPSSTHAGYWLNFTNWFMGKPLRHGDPFRKLALIRVGAGEYERFPEDSWSHLDMEVHEHPVLNGTTGEIQSKLEHHDYRGLKHYIAKHNEYSSWEAARFHWLRTADAEAWEQLNSRQQFKYRNLDKWWLSWVYFLVSYVGKRGFLDGRASWTFNRLKMRYFDDIRLKIREMEDGSRGSRRH